MGKRLCGTWRTDYIQPSGRKHQHSMEHAARGGLPESVGPQVRRGTEEGSL